jgi:hypothetical protein
VTRKWEQNDWGKCLSANNQRALFGTESYEKATQYMVRLVITRCLGSWMIKDCGGIIYDHQLVLVRKAVLRFLPRLEQPDKFWVG